VHIEFALNINVLVHQAFLYIGFLWGGGGALYTRHFNVLYYNIKYITPFRIFYEKGEQRLSGTLKVITMNR